MTPKISRRVALTLAPAALAGAGTIACAQQPASTVKLIVPFPAGASRPSGVA